MRFLPAVFLFVLFLSCQSEPRLQKGRWTGTLTPMNHPDMANPIAYQVSDGQDGISIQIVSPDSSLIQARNIKVEDDTLYFRFNEPEEQVLLSCVLGRTENKGYSGRCTDPSGKWAFFTMNPPAE